MGVSALPTHLIHERLYRRAVYKKGYREAAPHFIDVECGDEALQTMRMVLLGGLCRLFREKSSKYVCVWHAGAIPLGGEHELACDLAVYNRAALETAEVLSDDIWPVPRAVVDFGCDVDLALFDGKNEYYLEKIRLYRQFGVEQIAWIRPEIRSTILAGVKPIDWRVAPWSSTFNLLGTPCKLKLIYNAYLGEDVESLDNDPEGDLV